MTIICREERQESRRVQRDRSDGRAVFQSRWLKILWRFNGVSVCWYRCVCALVLYRALCYSVACFWLLFFASLFARYIPIRAVRIAKCVPLHCVLERTAEYMDCLVFWCMRLFTSSLVSVFASGGLLLGACDYFLLLNCTIRSKYPLSDLSVTDANSWMLMIRISISRDWDLCPAVP